MQQNHLLQLGAMFHDSVLINEKKWLIVNVSLCRAAAELYNGILFHLLQDNEEAPLMLTVNNRKAVIDFLDRNYPEHPPRKGIISWFNHMRIGEYLYIYPYVASRECDEFCDFLQQSLKYYNKHRGEKYVQKMMLSYAEQMKRMREFIRELHYEIFGYVPGKKIKYFGEPDKKKRVCIFCKKTVNDEGTTFKEKAHAISEAIGNKSFIQNEECDACNKHFADNVEEDLCNYLWLTRLKYGIRGKNGYPVFELENHYGRYIDTEQTDANWDNFEILKGKINGSYKGPALIGSADIKELDHLDIKLIKNFIPLHVYKSLVKYAIGLMDDKSLLRSHFQRTIAWLGEKDCFQPLPKVAVIRNPQVVHEPYMYLFKRKESVQFLPYCYGELRIGDKIFVFILPFCDIDDKDYTREHDFKYFVKECLSMYSNVRTYEDFSGIAEMPLNVTIDLTRFTQVDIFFLDEN